MIVDSVSVYFFLHKMKGNVYPKWKIDISAGMDCELSLNIYKRMNCLENEY